MLFRSLFGNVVAPDNFVDNTIRGCIITGTNNYVGDGCVNIVMNNCNRCTIPANVSNVSLVNCSDLIVTTSNVSYENNSIVVPDSVVISKTVTISSADILSSNTTPIKLIDAPGAGQAIVILPSTTIEGLFNTTAYASYLTMQIYTDTATTVQHVFTNVLNFTANTIKLGAQQVGSGSTQILENKDIYLMTAGGDPTAGDSNIKLFIQYIIINL